MLQRLVLLVAVVLVQLLVAVVAWALGQAEAPGVVLLVPVERPWPALCGPRTHRCRHQRSSCTAGLRQRRVAVPR